MARGKSTWSPTVTSLMRLGAKEKWSLDQLRRRVATDAAVTGAVLQPEWSDRIAAAYWHHTSKAKRNAAKLSATAYDGEAPTLEVACDFHFGEVREGCVGCMPAEELRTTTIPPVIGPVVVPTGCCFCGGDPLPFAPFRDCSGTAGGGHWACAEADDFLRRAADVLGQPAEGFSSRWVTGPPTQAAEEAAWERAHQPPKSHTPEPIKAPPPDDALTAGYRAAVESERARRVALTRRVRAAADAWRVQQEQTTAGLDAVGRRDQLAQCRRDVTLILTGEDT